MSTPFLSYTPLRDGYTFDPGYNVLELSTDGSGTRSRANVLYQPHKITINWSLSPSDYTKFMGFFRTTLANATRVFLMDLPTDIPIISTHRCRSVGMPQLNQVKGMSMMVSATLEVEANPTYTGNILYQEPGNVIFATTSPFLVGPIQAGDTIRIVDSSGTHPTGPTALNLDGVYFVASTTGFNQLTLTSPAAVNTDWAVLASLGVPGEYGDETHGDVTSTITRVPS